MTSHAKGWLRDNRLLAGFIALSITSGTSAGILHLILPLYALSLNIGDGGIGLFRSLTHLGGLVTTLPGGFLIDRYGPRRVYLVSGLLDVLFILLIPFAVSRTLLMLLIFTEGGISVLRWNALNSAFLDRLDYFGLVRGGWMRAAITIGFSFLGPPPGRAASAADGLSDRIRRHGGDHSGTAGPHPRLQNRRTARPSFPRR